MFEILFIVGGVAGFAYLNSRISNLEALIASKKNTQPQPHVTSTLSEVLMPGVQDSTPQAESPVSLAPGIQIQSPVSQPQQPATAVFDEESGGRWLGRLGIAALFIGIAFFLKYAFDTNLIGIVGRIILGVIAGAIFIGAGQYLRTKYEQYAYILIGGGAAILYLSFYAAFALYHLISQPVAFALTILVTVVTITLSIYDNAQPLAILAVLGGFGAPYFISTGQNDPLSLFTYIGILNITVVALAIRKNWSPLTYLAFVGTGLQYAAWYSNYYTPDQLLLAFLFLSFFFLIYLVIPTSNTLVGEFKKTTENDMVLATANAFCYFGVAYLLLNPLHHDSLWMFALFVGGIYYVLAYFIYSLNKTDIVLSRYYAGIATIAVTIAIPLKLDHSWITLAWLLEAALLYAISFIYSYSSFKVFAGVVYVVGVFKLFSDQLLFNPSVQTTPFFNEYTGLFVVAIAVAYFAAYLYHTYKKGVDPESDASLAAIFFVVANVLSVYILTSQISAIYNNQMGGYRISTLVTPPGYGGNTDLTNQRNTVISIMWSIYSILLIIVGFGMKARIARILGLVFFFITACEIFLVVWSQGELYRVIASIVFGAVALLGSFVYAKYSAHIKEIIYKN